MYSLLISSDDQAWSSDHHSFERSRFLEYTEPAIAAQFCMLESDEVERLKSLPAIFAYERGIEKSAKLGSIKLVRFQGDRIYFEYELSDTPPLPLAALEQLKLKLDVRDGERTRTHWAVKDVDLVSVLGPDAVGGLKVGKRERIPVVFVSYSHDSPDHKRWVLQFASELRLKGVEVMLDQWDIGYGDDLAAYMSRCVRSADRVLMICTESYVNKANDGRGGVGYEHMIVTGELMQDIGTSKFVPIIRQTSSPAHLPAALRSRFYVNMNDGSHLEEEWEKLLRELHNMPVVSKPPLGANPYSVSPSGQDVRTVTPFSNPLLTPAMSGGAASRQLSSPYSWYQSGAGNIASDDILSWRRLISEARQEVESAVLAWRAAHELAPANTEALVGETLECISSFSPLFALALAGVASGKSRYVNQTALLDEVLNPRNWNAAGLIVRIDVPRSAAFVYQALHGAMAMHVGRISVALSLAETVIPIPRAVTALPVWQQHDLTGWPESLGRNVINAWQTLIQLPRSLPWIVDLFGSEDDWITALTAYYMALSLNEFATRSGPKNSEIIAYGVSDISVPLCFWTVDDTLSKRAFHLINDNQQHLDEMFLRNGITRVEAHLSWRKWLIQCRAWLSNVYRGGAFSKSPYECLV